MPGFVWFLLGWVCCFAFSLFVALLAAVIGGPRHRAPGYVKLRASTASKTQVTGGRRTPATDTTGDSSSTVKPGSRSVEWAFPTVPPSGSNVIELTGSGLSEGGTPGPQPRGFADSGDAA